ncbi:hypothetical protein NHX12_005989 [Muraenolepis orangiensis]|uniref:Uncharacterized protein n=1 Tax=Muraenolepis orangiensis TaxID=630683 RepID=A0A9Q0DRP1_9TELE|nr:hypothetical protein NHX12_005989 [Muraenolepis orangiensis]
MSGPRSPSSILRLLGATGRPEKCVSLTPATTVQMGGPRPPGPQGLLTAALAAVLSDLGLMEEKPRKQDLRLMERPREQDLRLMEEPREQDLRLMEEPREQDLRLIEEPREQDLQLMEEPREQDLRLMEDLENSISD